MVWKSPSSTLSSNEVKVLSASWSCTALCLWELAFYTLAGTQLWSQLPTEEVQWWDKTHPAPVGYLSYFTSFRLMMCLLQKSKESMRWVSLTICCLAWRQLHAIGVAVLAWILWNNLIPSERLIFHRCLMGCFCLAPYSCLYQDVTMIMRGYHLKWPYQRS